ncbi:MAG: TRAP transporter small permease [Beijerinckiaceae bacterium]
MRAISKAYDGLIYGLAIAGGLVLAMIFVFVLMDAIMRDLLISPPPWSGPANEYGLLYVTMFAAPWLVRTRGHVLLELARQKLSPPKALLLERAVYVFCIAICAILAWHAINLYVEAWSTGEEDNRGIDIPRTWLYAPPAIAFPLMAVEFARYLFGYGSIYEGTSVSGETV